MSSVKIKIPTSQKSKFHFAKEQFLKTAVKNEISSFFNERLNPIFKKDAKNYCRGKISVDFEHVNNGNIHYNIKANGYTIGTIEDFGQNNGVIVYMASGKFQADNLNDSKEIVQYLINKWMVKKFIIKNIARSMESTHKEQTTPKSLDEAIAAGFQTLNRYGDEIRARRDASKKIADTMGKGMILAIGLWVLLMISIPFVS